MIIRVVKNSDLKRVVEIRHSIKEKNPLGIFSNMGKPFLRAYYKIIINNPYTVFVCAEDDNKLVLGFMFVVLDSADLQRDMKRHRLRLAFSALLSAVRQPSLFKQLFLRFKSLNNDRDDFVHTSGARIGYWGWSPNFPDPESSVGMHERVLQITKLCGVDRLCLEVDKDNKSIYKFHKLNGAVLEEEKTLPDGRVRALMYYDLSNRQ